MSSPIGLVLRSLLVQSYFLLIIFPSSLYIVFTNLHVGLALKLSLGSFNVLNACDLLEKGV